MQQIVFYALLFLVLLVGCESINASLDKCTNPSRGDYFECEMTKSNRITYDEYKALEKREADRNSLEK
jgi:hypothetical protein